MPQDPVAAVAALLSHPALAGRKRGLLVAVSGGADSMALLCAAAEAGPRLGWRVHALHADHGLRGEESAADAAFVRGWCRAHGVELDVVRARLAPGAGLERRAREWRRACYASAAQKKGAELVLLGHHARDQAETVLLNLVRGCGARGAAGMRPLAELGDGDGDLAAAKVLLGRPFLGLDPVGLRDWLGKRGQDWREDASNADVRFARNRVRHLILPELERINPRAVAHLAAFADGFASVEGPSIAPAGWDRASLGRLGAALKRGRGRVDLGRGWSLEVGSGRSRVLAPPESRALEGPGRYVWAGWSFSLKRGSPGPRMVAEEGGYWFSADLLNHGLRIRALRPGDKLAPFGFAGRRKAADLLREAGVPAWERAGWPALEADGRLLALPGARRGRGFEVRPGEPALRLAWRRPEPDAADLGMDKAEQGC